MALAPMSLSIFDAIRLRLVRIAADEGFPFSVKAPNATTRKAAAGSGDLRSPPYRASFLLPMIN